MKGESCTSKVQVYRLVQARTTFNVLVKVVRVLVKVVLLASG